MVVNTMPQFGASLAVINYAPRVVSNAPNIFITQATVLGIAIIST
jgi:hypothetical protein